MENTVYLLLDEKTRLFYTGFSSSDGYLILCDNCHFFVVDERYYYSAKQKLTPLGLAVICDSTLATLNTVMRELDCKTLGVDFTKMTKAECDTLSSLGYQLVDISDKVRDALSEKDFKDIKKTQKACKIAEKALKLTLPHIKTGITESQLATILEYNMRLLGSEMTSFDTIVAFGGGSSVPHHKTGNRKLKANEPILIDFGCVYKGFCSDMTRTFYYGEPTKEFVKAYNLVLKAHLKSKESITANCQCCDIDSVARDIFKQNGCDKHFTHSLGHGVGVNIHEAPNLSPNSEDILKNGNVFTIEPGLYFNGKFGIRIEDTLYMSDNKVKSFFYFTKKLVKIPVKD